MLVLEHCTFSLRQFYANGEDITQTQRALCSAVWTDSRLKHNFEVDTKCEHNGIVVEKETIKREIQSIPQEILQDSTSNFWERLAKLTQF